MRRLAISLLLALPSAVAAQEDLTVLKGDGDVPARKLLLNYLQGQAQKAFDARRASLAELGKLDDKSKMPVDLPAKYAKRQAELKAKFIEAIGGFPERTPLNAKVIGTEKADGYRIEKVIYESRPHHHVTANLYLPDGKGPFPAVIVPCGHTSNGKAGYQAVCVILAKHGIAALCYDPIGQGERVQLPTDTHKSLVGGSTNEHTMVGVGALLVGQSTASFRIWDGMRSIDYLQSRSEIDPKRIGCTGSSGGGTLTSYLMALDDRIVAAAPSCYVTSLEKLFTTIGPQDGEQNIPGQVAFGMEHADYLFLRAPKPTLILCATRDFFDIGGTWQTYREAKQFYGVFGHGERVDLFEFNTGHAYPRAQREAMLRFMQRWLLNKDGAATEDDFTPLKDAQLQCTRTGQVIEDLKGKSAFDLIAERENELAKLRTKWQESHSKEELSNEVRRLIGVAPSIAAAKPKSVGKVQRDGYAIVKTIYETEPSVLIPALVFTPEKPVKDQPTVLYAHGESKAIAAAAGGPIEKLVKAGRTVVALDLRGLGEIAPGVYDPKKPSYFGVDFRETFMAMHLNRPLLGQRVHDLLAVLEGLAAESPGGFEVISSSTAGPAALHASALDSRIKAVTLDKSLVSWSSVAKTSVSYNQLTNVVPGALKVYDLPDLVKVIAPRKVTITNPLDAASKPVAQAMPTPAPPLAASRDLPRVVLIGDSIRMGYAPLVAKKLEGKAVVISAKDNGEDSRNVLKHLDEWAINEKPSVIHFNCGLHDLKLSQKTKTHQVELAQYEANLKQIVDRLKKETSAVVVFAATTPIHDERHAARKGGFDRTEADVKKYNETGLKVMRSAGVPVHDLHWVVELGSIDRMLGPDGTHYGAAANEKLADAVADCILRQLTIATYTPGPPVKGGPEVADAYRKNEKERDAAVPDYFKKLPAGQFKVPDSAAAWKEQRPDVRKKVLDSLGDLPPRPSPQKVRLISREYRTGYTLEKVAIDNGVESEVSALILIPDNLKKPAPAVLWLHSSTPDKTQVIIPNTNGGAEPIGEVLVKAGYVVLSPDAYWHGDRLGTGPAGAREFGARAGEQESLFKYHLLMGRTLWGMFVRDDQIALDYLCSRPEVDKTRIGCTGMSMGGTRTWWLAAVDERISCAVTVACLTRFQNLLAHGNLRAHGVYLFLIGILKHFDTEGVVALTAPRPFLALTGDLDYGSPADGIQVIEEKVSKVYEVLGAKEKFKNVLYKDTGHLVTPEMRAETLAWFDRWLKP